jgi:hypothetical protein
MRKKLLFIFVLFLATLIYCGYEANATKYQYSDIYIEATDTGIVYSAKYKITAHNDTLDTNCLI